MPNYQSQYTGAQIDEAVGKATKVEANPSETGTTDLTSLKVGETVYNVPSGGGNEYTVDTTDMFNIRVDLDAQLNGASHVLLFNAISSKTYYPTRDIGSLNTIACKCSMLVILSVGSAPSISGDLYNYDGVLVTSSNVTSHLNELLYLASDVSINSSVGGSGN